MFLNLSDILHLLQSSAPINTTTLLSALTNTESNSTKTGSIPNRKNKLH